MPKNRKTYAQKVAAEKRNTQRLSQNVQIQDTSQTFSFSFLPKTKTSEKNTTDTNILTDLRKTALLTGILILCEAILWIVMNLRK